MKILKYITIMIMLSGLIGIVYSNPQGPNSMNVSSSGRNAANTATLQVDAKAGNVTALIVDGTRVTESWQGYYGNISGTITLDDAFNFTFYDWALPNPTGEIYAANGSSVTWANVYCMNLSHSRNHNGSGSDAIYYNINMTQIELNFGINLTDRDGLNETFNDTYINSVGFRVGATTINTDDGCSMTHPYVDESANTAWQELLLTDNESLIFTSIIRDSQNGYQPNSGDTSDFQLLVLENGHYGSEDATTPYYFYVELS